jgi:hypothetical protein
MAQEGGSAHDAVRRTRRGLTACSAPPSVAMRWHVVGIIALFDGSISHLDYDVA